MLPQKYGAAYFVAASAVLIAGLRIGCTWPLVTETTDEAYQIACGIEWLATRQYTYETEHPPLARIAVALGPYVLGVPFHHQPKPALEGRPILDRPGGDESWPRHARAICCFFSLPAGRSGCLRPGRPEPYGWLEHRQPALRAGRSIFIYDLRKGAAQ